MKRWLVGIGCLILIALVWFATSDSDRIWPIRNTLQYEVYSRWWGLVGEPETGPGGTLTGSLHDEQGQPIPNAWVLISRWNGTAFQDQTDAEGRYRIEKIPAGRYMPISTATDYEDTTFGPVTIRPETETDADVTLPLEPPHQVAPGTELVVGEATPASCDEPLPGEAIRRQISFDNAGSPNQLTYFYTPSDATPEDRYPILLIIYPGPADEWECIGVPLAAAGYATLGIGPVYSFDLADQIDELQRLLMFAEAERLPNADPTQIAALAGSFSSLHVQHLIRRKAELEAAVLLGGPTDIFAMREYLEEKSFIPPFGLDKFLVALGLPDRQPELYLYISERYHVHPDWPSILLIHSRSDEVVPVSQTEVMAVELEAFGIPHQVHYFDGASHYLMSPSGEAQGIFDTTINFLENEFAAEN